MLLFPVFVTQKSRGTGMPNGTYSSVMRQENKLRVVINVLTKVKQQKDNKCAHF